MRQLIVNKQLASQGNREIIQAPLHLAFSAGTQPCVSIVRHPLHHPCPPATWAPSAPPNHASTIKFMQHAFMMTWHATPGQEHVVRCLLYMTLPTISAKNTPVAALSFPHADLARFCSSLCLSVARLYR
jgi:hypothetical protein